LTGSLGTVTGGLTGALGAVTGAASGLLKTATGITANLSTGLGALPGGASVVASVVNNAVGAINSVPGVSAVTGLIGQASSITNGISNLASVNPLASSGILTAATGAAGALTKGLDDLKSGKLSLASLASAGLPAGAAAQLNSAISSMSSGGAVPIKLPTVAINTNDRSELTAQVTSLLGNSKIPAPNYGGLSSSIKSESDRLNELVKQQQALEVEKDEQSKKVKQARDAFIQVRDTLPPGDPAIAEAKQTYIAEVKAFGDITDKISAIANKA
jgi:hypothetical protein